MKHTVGKMHEKTDLTNERRKFHEVKEQVGDNMHEITQVVSQTEFIISAHKSRQPTLDYQRNIRHDIPNVEMIRNEKTPDISQSEYIIWAHKTGPT
jgi:hypothetical protein